MAQRIITCRIEQGRQASREWRDVRRDRSVSPVVRGGYPRSFQRVSIRQRAPRSIGEATVRREERAVQGLGKGHVAGFGCSDVVANFPPLAQQSYGRVDSERKA